MSKKARKALSLLLSLVLLCGLCVPSAFAAEGTYSDTQGHWAEEAIERWSEYGIVEGNNGRFNPNASLTRAQMAKVLANTLGLTETAANPFSDVSENDWFAPYVLRCYAAGVMMGDNGKANPNATITRQQAMVMLCRALGIAPVNNPDLSAFTDSGKVGAWAAPYVAAMVESGIVGGIGNGQLAPGGNLSRAALMAILDRSVVQYINAPGTYELVNKDGIILVAAGKVTLTGKTSADILVTPAADGSTLTFDKATVTGSITVQADNAKITSKNSKLPEIAMTGEGSSIEESKPASGGSSGGSSAPSYSNLTVAEPKTVSSGTYQNVTITDAVGDGEVTLTDLTIRGDLTIHGGGSSSIKLVNCTIGGKVIMDKTTTVGSTQQPRLELTNTPISSVEVQKPAIIEAADAASPVAAVEARADVEVRGAQTAVAAVTVPAAVETPVALTVSAGTVAKVEAKGETTITGAANSVSAVVAEAPVTVASAAVDKVEIPASAPADMTVAVTGTEAIDVEINSSNGVAITADDSSNITVSTGLETAPDNITVDGGAVTHLHKWDEGTVTIEATCKDAGVKTYTCIADGCTDPAATKAEKIPALPHTEVVDPAVAATCTEAGKTEGRHCSVCGTVIAAQTEIPAKGHTEVVDAAVEATCTEAGKTEGKHCSVCGTVIAAQTEIPAKDHTEVIDAAVAATCTEAGKTEGKHCSVCNAVITAQDAIPALGHDFTGNYLNDADGHWHKCTRCDAVDTKTAHTYNTTSCSEAAVCSVCSYEKAAGQHTWGGWVKVDDTDHKHICSACQTEERAAHTWDAGVVTTEPTDTTEGVKTYTCSVCNGTKTEKIPVVGTLNVWFTKEGSTYYLNWTPVELASGEYYYVNGECTYSSEAKRYLSDSMLKGFTETASITVGHGPYGGQTELLYTAENAVVVEPLDAASYTITGQESGQYLIEADRDDTDFTYYGTLRGPDGAEVISSVKSTTGLVDMSPWAGCTMDVYMNRITISQDTGTLTMQRTPVTTVSEITLCTAPAGVTEVSDYNSLSAALRKGGTVRLLEDITSQSPLSATSGPAATLDLNGHVLSVSVLTVANGKELSIDGTTEGSAITVSNEYNQAAINVYGGAILTITGGQYQGLFNGANVRSITLSGATVTAAKTTTHAIQLNNAGGPVSFTNVTATAEASALLASNCPAFVISGGSYTSTGDDMSATSDALNISTCVSVTLENVTAEAKHNAVYLRSVDNVTVTGGTYTSTGTQSGNSDALYVTNCGTVGISGLTANAVTYAVDIRDSGAVTVTNSDLTCTSDSYAAGCSFNSQNNTSVEMSSVTATAYLHPMKVDGSSKLTDLHITGSTFQATAPADASSSSYAIEIIRIGTATLDSVIASGHEALRASTCTTLTLTGASQFLGAKRGSTSGIGIHTNVCPAVQVNVSKVTGELQFDTSNDAVISITGGTFDQNPSAYVNTETHTITENTTDSGTTYTVAAK
ncbi:S-layer homology domain-containing protein [Oscillibacter valericigenes]|uniref:S-layer homology domain-containing protein n=1 Tax=Oscillibacter valericigenes TaxID=351091 RepID=UPI001F1C6109|nr:S-layer homology domain-containing protein [Oscillibacter valericigenes]MCF2618046.1 S-layer homology domain-containing protein [Oscillibacter valericigenes]